MASRSKPKKPSSRVEPTLSNQKPQNLGQAPSKPRSFKVTSDPAKRTSKSGEGSTRAEKPKTKTVEKTTKREASTSRPSKSSSSKAPVSKKPPENVALNKKVVLAKKTTTSSRIVAKKPESKSKPIEKKPDPVRKKVEAKPSSRTVSKAPTSSKDIRKPKKDPHDNKEKKKEISKIIENGHSEKIEKRSPTPPPLKIENSVNSTNLEKNLGSLDTVESGVSMTSPHDSSDPDVEESISSRFVEVDDNDYPSPPSSFAAISSTNQSEMLNNTPSKDSDDNYAYEEDFDSYESDFENDEPSTVSSSSSSSSSSSEVESSSSREDSEEDLREDVSPVRTVSPRIQSPTKVLENPTRPKSSKAYVNFAKAKQKQSDQQASEKIKSRGQLLQDMVQLDVIKVTLFVQIPDSYDAYIRAFGHASSVQVSLQTNEDSLSESVQTDPCVMLSKWTQKPAQIVMTSGVLPTREDYLGVGGDCEETNGDVIPVPSSSFRFSKFLTSASTVILQLLEESIIPEEQFASTDEESGFGQLGVKLGSSVSSLLDGRKTTLVQFCEFDPSVILTGHEGKMDEDEPDADDKESSSDIVEDASLICVWSSNQPSFPTDILCCRSSPICTSFSPGKPVIVVAGLKDGSLCTWDLREDSSNHPLVTYIGDSHWRIKPPSFITACSEEDCINASPIICLETLKLQESNQSRQGTFQVVSLNSDGIVTWWVVVQGGSQLQVQSSTYVSPHLGASPWSRIGITKAASIDINTHLSSEEPVYGGDICRDLKLSTKEPSQLFVAASNGSVLHCSRHNAKLHPSAFIPEIQPSTEAVTISVCPHDHNFFMVGGSDGLIRLHTMHSSSALTCFQASTNPDPILKIQWSSARPCVIYMLDAKARFHIWDLMAGDIYPTVTYGPNELIKDGIMTFDVAQVRWQDDLHAPYAAFASGHGSIILRPVAHRYLSRNEEEYKNELHRFRCYASII